MNHLEYSLFTPSTVREMDRIAIGERGIPGYELMCRAGQAAFDAARTRYEDAHNWLVACGSGNNGGDGYVIARLALDAGLDVRVYALAAPDRLAGDAATACKAYRDAGGVIVASPPDQYPQLVVDALLGTGLDREVTGEYRAAVEWMNAQPAPVIAVDIASGISGTTGQVMGAAVAADLTVTFVGQKLGPFVGDGPDYCGELVFDPIGIPSDVAAGLDPVARIFAVQDLEPLLPRRRRSAHKGHFGHVLVIGGNHGMGGAVRLAGEAALRCGAGLVTVVTRPENVAAVTGYRPELMCRGAESADELPDVLERATTVAVGPGLGRDAWARSMLRAACDADLPTVVDADALNLLAESPESRDRWIITPHPGEAATLLGCTTAAIQQDRLGAIGRLTARYGGAAVLKGCGTLIGRENVLPWLIRAGNPGMASAGMGDVLTGITAGVLAQAGTDDLGRVAAAAAFIHAAAGDAAASVGERGLIATDLFGHLRPWLNP